MRKFIFLFFILIATLSSCVKDHLATEEEYCTEDILQKYNMKPASEHPSTFACYSYLSLYDYNGTPYYQWGSPCADYIFNPEDCNGVYLCEDPLDPSCTEKLQALELIRLVGIGD